MDDKVVEWMGKDEREEECFLMIFVEEDLVGQLLDIADALLVASIFAVLLPPLHSLWTNSLRKKTSEHIPM